MAAKLNILNGADTTSAIDAAIAGAEEYFSGANASRSQLLAWASALDQYNNGLIGPGHCDE